MSATMWATAWILGIQATAMTIGWLLARQGAGAEAMLAVQLGALVLMLGGLVRLHRWAWAPAAQLLAQLEALCEWRFEQQRQPAVPEWVPLSRALNVLVGRLQSNLSARDAAVSNLRSQLALDELTHAASRQHFMLALTQMLQSHRHDGGVAILRVNDLEGLNHRLGRSRTDELLVAMVATLRALLNARLPENSYMLARLNGADFGLQMTGTDKAGLRHLLEALSQGLQRLADDGLTDRQVTVWIGGVCCTDEHTSSQVLARLDTLVNSAMTSGKTVCLGDLNETTRYTRAQEWSHVIDHGLDTGHLELTLVPVRHPDGHVIHHEGRLHLLLPDGQRIESEELAPAGLRTGRSSDLDLKAVELALGCLADEALEVAVALMPQSLVRPNFERRLKALLEAHPQRTRRLTLELSDMRDTGDLLRLLRTASQLAQQTGCHLGLRDFGCGRTALPLLETVRLRHAHLGQALQQGSGDDAQAGRPTATTGSAAFVQLLREWAARTGVTIIDAQPKDLLNAATTSLSEPLSQP